MLDIALSVLILNNILLLYLILMIYIIDRADRLYELFLPLNSWTMILYKVRKMSYFLSTFLTDEHSVF